MVSQYPDNLFCLEVIALDRGKESDSCQSVAISLTVNYYIMKAKSFNILRISSKLAY